MPDGQVFVYGFDVILLEPVAFHLGQKVHRGQYVRPVEGEPGELVPETPENVKACVEWKRCNRGTIFRLPDEQAGPFSLDFATPEQEG